MRLLRWAERLNVYNFDMVYRQGCENSVPDVLSRYVSSSETVDWPCPEEKADVATVATIFGSTAIKAITPNELATETVADTAVENNQLL